LLKIDWRWVDLHFENLREDHLLTCSFYTLCRLYILLFLLENLLLCHLRLKYFKVISLYFFLLQLLTVVRLFRDFVSHTTLLHSYAGSY